MAVILPKSRTLLLPRQMIIITFYFAFSFVFFFFPNHFQPQVPNFLPQEVPEPGEHGQVTGSIPKLLSLGPLTRPCEPEGSGWPPSSNRAGPGLAPQNPGDTS